MSCDRVRGELKAWADRELPAALHGEIERHLSGCADCRRELNEIQKLSVELRALDGVAPPTALHNRILAGLPETPAERPARLFYWPRVWLPSLGLAGAAALALVVGYRLVDQSVLPGPPSAGGAGRMASVPAAAAPDAALQAKEAHSAKSSHRDPKPALPRRLALGKPESTQVEQDSVIASPAPGETRLEPKDLVTLKSGIREQLAAKKPAVSLQLAPAPPSGPAEPLGAPSLLREEIKHDTAAVAGPAPQPMAGAVSRAKAVDGTDTGNAARGRAGLGAGGFGGGFGANGQAGGAPAGGAQAQDRLLLLQASEPAETVTLYVAELDKGASEVELLAQQEGGYTINSLPALNSELTQASLTIVVPRQKVEALKVRLTRVGQEGLAKELELQRGLGADNRAGQGLYYRNQATINQQAPTGRAATGKPATGGRGGQQLGAKLEAQPAQRGSDEQRLRERGERPEQQPRGYAGGQNTNGYGYESSDKANTRRAAGSDFGRQNQRNYNLITEQMTKLIIQLQVTPHSNAAAKPSVKK